MAPRIYDLVIFGGGTSLLLLLRLAYGANLAAEDNGRSGRLPMAETCWFRQLPAMRLDDVMRNRKLVSGFGASCRARSTDLMLAVAYSCGKGDLFYGRNQRKWEAATPPQKGR